jgi:hypothetical protein
VGKSALLAEYQHRYQGQSFPGTSARHHRPETLRPGDFERSLAAQLAQALLPYRQIIEDGDHLQKRLEEADKASALEMVVLDPLGNLPSHDVRKRRSRGVGSRFDRLFARRFAQRSTAASS